MVFRCGRACSTSASANGARVWWGAGVAQPSVLVLAATVLSDAYTKAQQGLPRASGQQQSQSSRPLPASSESSRAAA